MAQSMMLLAQSSTARVPGWMHAYLLSTALRDKPQVCDGVTSTREVAMASYQGGGKAFSVMDSTLKMFELVWFAGEVKFFFFLNALHSKFNALEDTEIDRTKSIRLVDL